MISIAKPLIGEAEKKAVAEVLDSGMIANGAIVTQFENEFAAYLGAKYAVATTSGTTALEVALRSLGIGNGDKVLTTPFSFIASTNAILYVGTFRFHSKYLEYFQCCRYWQYFHCLFYRWQFSNYEIGRAS